MYLSSLQTRIKNRGLASLLVCCFLLAGKIAIAEPKVFDEYAVKAAMLFHLPGFTRWPERAKNDVPSTLDVCILTGDDVRNRFEVLDNRAIAGYRFRLKIVDGKMEYTDCDLLFISKAREYRLSRIFKRVEGLSILTVGETDAFVEDGGMISLITKNHKIKLKINLAAVRKEDIKLNSRLLGLATVIGQSE